MRRQRPEWRLALAMALAVAASACQATQDGEQAAPSETDRPPLGLMTSLPIYWGETAQISDLLDGSVQRHWVRDLLEENYALVPLDVLGTTNGQPREDLAALDHLIVAQPRALTAADNVALDRWVRKGGRLLLVLDPMMTEHSPYHIGDKRRFNDVALIPPLLDRWGLSFGYDKDAPPRQVPFGSTAIPAEEYGTLSLTTPSAEESCAVEAAGLVARCRIGAGQALIVADAAFLNQEGDRQANGQAADAVLAAAFD